jgi:hypothetical protein
VIHIKNPAVIVRGFIEILGDRVAAAEDQITTKRCPA